MNHATKSDTRDLQVKSPVYTSINQAKQPPMNTVTQAKQQPNSTINQAKQPSNNTITQAKQQPMTSQQASATKQNISGNFP